MFENIKDNIGNLSSLVKLTTEEVRELQLQFPSLPQDYIEFLREIGSGNLGDIQIYSGPTNPDSVYPSISSELAQVVLVGDDLQGYCFAFDMIDGFRLVEVDPQGNVDRSIEQRFEDLIRRFHG